ncbi:MAG: glycosyltransferase family 39 protein [Ardenticatenia bacterium]|nr:glycosyltransferase family 39 protein [Ardenticatenia bacterium]
MWLSPHPTSTSEAPAPRGGTAVQSQEMLWARRLVLGVLLVVGLYARVRYAREISLFVDEFTTMWAAKRTLEYGIPLMPSGVLYTRGLLASYAEATFLAVRYTPFAARLVSVVLSVATILMVYHVGRRLFDARVGLVAAAFMTLAPEAIVWGGRARFYTQLQLFVLLTAWAFYEALRTSRRSLYRRFALLFVLALFSQEETILLYPALIVAGMAWRGVQAISAPGAPGAHATVLGAIVARYLVEKWGQPGYFETIQARRPYVGLILDVRGALAEYGPFFAEPVRVVISLLVFVALLAAGQALRRTWRPLPWREALWRGLPALGHIEPAHRATLYTVWLFSAVFGVILLFVGPTWREMRYIFMLVPFWFLPAAAGLTWLWDRLASGKRWQDVGVAGIALLTAGLFLPDARRTLDQQVEGYDLALAYIARERQPGDVILTPQPPACAATFGPCDYYAIQKDYEEYVIRRDGIWVDRWSGAPLLNTTEQLRHVIRTHPRTFFLVDGYRLATRYEPDFLRVLVEQMDVVFADRGIVVLAANGWREVSRRPVVHTYAPPVNFGGRYWPPAGRNERDPGGSRRRAERHAHVDRHRTGP